MKKAHTKVTEPSEVHLIEKLAYLAGGVKARAFMSEANHIANIQLMQALKEDQRFDFFNTDTQPQISWEACCQSTMKASVAEVDGLILQLPSLIENYHNRYEGNKSAMYFLSSLQGEIKRLVVER